LAKVKAETGLPVATEVANAAHTESALKAGVDILWLGARTTVNPFSVQEIAGVLQGVDIPVMVKNPVTPDLQLWIGALERIQNVGIRNLAAIHRGFSSFEKTKFRNAPEWAIPIELKRLMPEIPMICDPSHIAGNRKLLLPVAQKALDLDYHGLMIETHPRPDEAWSDARQQISPAELAGLLDSLKFKRQLSENQDIIHKLRVLREKIDSIDNRLLEILAERMDLVRAIGQYKKDNGITVLQIHRWTGIRQDRLQNGLSLGLTEQMILDLYELIHMESIQLQERIIHGKNEA
jgi:chorismate mutase